MGQRGRGMARLQREDAAGVFRPVVPQGMRGDGRLRLMDASTAAGTGFAAVRGRMPGFGGWLILHRIRQLNDNHCRCTMVLVTRRLGCSNRLRRDRKRR